MIKKHKLSTTNSKKNRSPRPYNGNSSELKTRLSFGSPKSPDGPRSKLLFGSPKSPNKKKERLVLKAKEAIIILILITKLRLNLKN